MDKQLRTKCPSFRTDCPDRGIPKGITPAVRDLVWTIRPSSTRIAVAEPQYQEAMVWAQ